MPNILEPDSVYVVPDTITEFIKNTVLPFGWTLETSTVSRSILLQDPQGVTQQVITYEAIEDGANIRLALPW